MTDEAATAWLVDHEQYINHHARVRCTAAPEDAAQEARIEVLKTFRLGGLHTDGFLRSVIIRRIQGFASGKNPATTVVNRGGTKVYDMMRGTPSHHAPQLTDFTDPLAPQVGEDSSETEEVLGRLTALHMVRNLPANEKRHALARAEGWTTADLARETGRGVSTLNAEWRVIKAQLQRELAA